MLTLIYDMSNIIHRTAKARKDDRNDPLIKPEDVAGLTMHIALMTINKWFNKYHPQRVVFAFEGGKQNSWRKVWTASNSKRGKEYKGNRVYDPAFEFIYKLMDDFRDLMKAHTSITCLDVPGMEADDSIAAYCQLYANPDEQVLIISGDKDFIQLLKNPNVKLVNPDDGKLRNQPGGKEYEPDIDYWIFLKCIRGDMGDYVHSAFPRVRETKVRKAWESEYDRVNLMNEKWVDVDGTEHRVGDLYEENKLLLDLTQQPDELRSYLVSEVTQQCAHQAKYAHFYFLGFCNRYRLKRLAEDAGRFINLFSCNQRTAAGQQPKLPPAERQAAVIKANSSPLEF